MIASLKLKHEFLFGKPIKFVSFTTDDEEIFDFGDAMDGRYFNVATKYVEFIVLLPHGEVLLDAEYKMKSYHPETLERISAAHLQLVTRHPFVTLPDGFDEETSPIFMYEWLSAGEAKWNDFGWKPTEAWIELYKKFIEPIALECTILIFIKE
jgi:hypothetical protein